MFIYIYNEVLRRAAMRPPLLKYLVLKVGIIKRGAIVVRKSTSKSTNNIKLKSNESIVNNHHLLGNPRRETLPVNARCESIIK